jgi:hypothetical protein
MTYRALVFRVVRAFQTQRTPLVRSRLSLFHLALGETDLQAFALSSRFHGRSALLEIPRISHYHPTAVALC